MKRVYPTNEEEYLTPPNLIEVDEEKEEKTNMINNALYYLNRCVSELYSLNEDRLAIDLEEFKDSINELREFNEVE